MLPGSFQYAASARAQLTAILLAALFPLVFLLRFPFCPPPSSSLGSLT